MLTKRFEIEGIPAILWGEKSDKLFITVHGNMSSKEDVIIKEFVKESAKKGYQTLSFDLPEHGERKDKDYPCKVENCVNDLNKVMAYAKRISKDISLFACSMGAYFSLLAYKNEKVTQCLFLSPIVEMESIIEGMMETFKVSKDMLKAEKEIETPFGYLYWDYYCYVKDNPINIWDKKTSILYGSKDNMSKFSTISSFADRFKCDLKVIAEGEHYFHTEEQIEFFCKWAEEAIN